MLSPLKLQVHPKKIFKKSLPLSENTLHPYYKDQPVNKGNKE
jgi:hypothetical protein